MKSSTPHAFNGCVPNPGNRPCKLNDGDSFKFEKFDAPHNAPAVFILSGAPLTGPIEVFDVCGGYCLMEALMGREEKIKAILDALAEAETSARHPELAPLIGSAINAVKASSRRACMGEPRTSTAACLSVAGGAMAPIAAACRIGGAIAPEVLTPLMRTVKHSADLVGRSKSRPCKSEPHQEVPPHGWKGKPGGEFKRKSADGEILWIVRRPHIPGGNWSLYYGSLPIGACDTSDDAAMLAVSFEALVNSSAQDPEVIQAS